MEFGLDALSTTMTSAPRSAKICPPYGPGPIPFISITLIPASGPIDLPSCILNKRAKYRFKLLTTILTSV